MAVKTPEVPRIDWNRICERWQAGDTMTAIGHEYGVKGDKIKKILVELNAFDRVKLQPKQRSEPRVGNAVDLRSFAKAARSILWRADPGKEHPTYEKWEKRVKALTSKEGGGLGQDQAVVCASKDFKCLHHLFRMHDVAEYDHDPESHPAIQHWGEANGVDAAEVDVVFEGTDFSYRENLRWAMEAAGEFLRSRKHPRKAPNGSAWFFYRQSIDEPKDFMAKYGQMEAKADGGEDNESRKDSRRSVEEIHTFLKELDSEEEEDGT